MDESEDTTYDWTNEPDAVEAVCIAQNLLAGTTPLVQGSRLLWKALKELCYEHNESFSAINQVVGKSAEYPMPEDRHLWVPAVAAAKEAEFEAWLSLVRPKVKLSCGEVVRRFGKAR